MFDTEKIDALKKIIADARHITVIQAENPDGDSLGSALALEEIFSDLNKEVFLHCPVDIPKYLRYFVGWSRVTQDFPSHTDAIFFVDTTSETLISKTLDMPHARHTLEHTPVFVLDHHTETAPTFSFPFEIVCETAVATGELLYNISHTTGWDINPQAAEHMLGAILSDSLGLSTQNTSAESFRVAGKLVELGASSSTIENRRREFMKKSPEILAYKGVLLSRIEYFLGGAFALVHIPWEEIQAYSDQYNPSVLVLDEMRLVEGVEIAIAIKTYPDGKLTGKLRANLPICTEVAGYFGGGGHVYASGFRTYETYEKILPELIQAVDAALLSLKKS